MEDNKKRLYQALIADYDLGDFDTFAKDVEDSTKRKSLYDAISQDYDLGDFDSFTNQLLGSKPSSSDTPMAEKPAVATDNYVLSTPFLSEENKPFAEEHPMGLESQGEIITPFRAEDEKLTTTYQEALSKKGTDLGGPIDMEGTIAKARQTADFAGGVAGEIKAQSGNPFPPKLSATDLDAFKTPEQKAEENYFNRAGDQALYYLQAESQLNAELQAVEEELAALEHDYYQSDEYLRSRMMKSMLQGPARQSWDDFAFAPPRLIELQKRRTALLQAKEHKAVAEEIGRNKMEYGTVGEYFSNALTGAKSFAKEKLSSVDPRNRSVEVLADKLSLSRKLTNGETLSPDEQDAWTIYALEDMMEGRYGKAKEDFGYIAGNAAPMMVEFMAELALSPGKGLAKGAMTAAERKAAEMTQKLIRKYGASAVRKNLMRMGAGIYKQGARLAGAAANAAIATHTTQADDLVKGTMERMAGTAVGTPDEEGNLVGTGVKDAKDFGQAYYEQAANMTIENLTEAIFEGAGIGKGFKSLLTGTGKKLAGTKVGGKVVGAAAKLADTKTVKAMSELIENTKSSNWYRSVSKLKLAGHLGSIPEEMMEEYAAIPLRHWLGVNDGEQGLWEELTSRQTFYNTAAGLSLGMGAMTAVQVVPPATAMAAGAVWDKYNMFRTHRNLIRRDKEGQNLFGAEWESVKTQIESFTEENFGEGMDALVEEFDSPEKKDAAWRYAQSLQQDRGFNTMRQKAKEEGESDPLADAREEGYEAEDPQRVDAWRAEYDRLHAKWGSLVEEAVAQYGGLNLFFDTLRENPDGETAMREILRYYELKERIEGAEARKADEAETDEEALRSNVERRTNQETGKIVTVNILGDTGQPTIDIATGEPSSYYVINGATDTGDGNVALSDGMVVLRDADGNRQALPGDKLRLVSVMQPEQIIAEEQARATQAAAPVQAAAPEPAAVAGNSADLAAELEKTEEGRGVKEQVDAWFAQGEEPGSVEQLLSSTAARFAPLGMDYYNALSAESPANAAPAAEGAAGASSAPTSRIMRKKGDIDAEASFENGATAQEMADAYAQEYGEEEGLALSTAQEHLTRVQEERQTTKDIDRKNGSLRKQEKFWNEVVDLLTPKEETVAEEGRQETVGTPVALQYLLEGGKGPIENAGYFFYAIQAAFPHIGAQLQEIRNSMSAEMLGMAPDAFVASNPSQLQEVRRLVEATYGEAGTRILDQILANSTGFYPREGKVLDLEIENLKPVEGNEQTQEATEKDSIRFDNQGNPIDESGRLILEEIESIDQISDQDFEDPTRNIILPAIPDNVAEAVGTNGKPVIIKKNIFERNLIRHSDLTPDQSRDILKSALYSPDIYGQNQKRRRVNNWVVISVSDKQSSGTNKLVLLEVNENKENVEIVHWHYLDKRGMEKLKRQTEREGGQLLILPSASAEEVGALSDLTSDLPSDKTFLNSDGRLIEPPVEGSDLVPTPNIVSSADKGTDKSVTAEGTQEEISENAQNATQSEQNELEKAEKERIDALVPTIEDVADGMQTADEFVAGLFGNGIRITPESFRKETGQGWEEQRRLVGIIAGKEKGGLTVEQAAETIVENYRAELAERGFSGDSMEMRDMVIDILSSGNPRAYAKEAAARRPEQALHREMEAFDRYTQEAFHMSAEEYIMYEESMLPKYIEQYKDFDEQEYYSNFADEQSTQNEHDTTRESAETGGSREILSEEQPSATPGEGAAGEGQQGGTLQGDVQGDAQEGLARAEAGQEVADKSTAKESQTRFSTSTFEDAERIAREEQRRAPLRRTARAWEKLLGVKVTLMERLEDVKDPVARREIEAAEKKGKNVPGWYSEKEGVFLYLPHVKDVTEVDKTCVHEIVSHKGLKELLGQEKFDELCRKVWGIMSPAARKKYRNYPNVHNELQAADEYIAHLSEEVELTARERSVWQKIMDFFADLLGRKADNRSKAASIVGKETLSGKDIAELVRLSYAEYLQRNGKVSGQKKSPNTVAGSSQAISSASAVSGEIAAKLIDLFETYKKKDNNRTRGFITDLSKALGISIMDGSSRYKTFNVNGKNITLRLSNHNALIDNFDKRREGEGVSIVISSSRNSGIKGEGDAHIVEFFYSKKRVEKANDKPLAKIIDSIRGLLETGEFKDTTGLAERQEVNGMKFRVLSDKNGKKTLVGLHNISEAKLRKAISLGGLANPSMAVIDLDKQSHVDYGEITLVAPESLVDKKTGKNIGTFLADAYTPIYPTVVKKMPDKAGKVLTKALESVDETFRSKVRTYFNSYLDSGTVYDALFYWYLSDTGKNPPILEASLPDGYTREEVKKLKEVNPEATIFADLSESERRKVIDLYIEKEGGNEKYESDLAKRIEGWKNAIEDENAVPARKAFSLSRLNEYNEYGYEYNRISNYYSYAIRLANASSKPSEVETFRNAYDEVVKNGLEEDFGNWLMGKEAEMGVEEKLFAGYDNQGRAKYLPNTLENASKLMKKEGRAGATGLGGFNYFVAILAPLAKSTKEISKKKENLSTQEEYDAFSNKWHEYYHRLALQLQPGADKWADYGYHRLHEIAPMANPKDYVKREYGIDLSDKFMKDLNEVKSAIKNDFPARYFETKFERPVYLNEFAAAVVPNDISLDLYGQLQRTGIPLYEYERGNNESRMEAVDKVTVDNEGIRFRVSNDNQEIFVSNAQRAVEGIKQEKGTPQQWLAMIEKNGGLKAGEDKWLGLSDWLKGMDKKSVTKDEILDFIGENKIRIEEVTYGEEAGGYSEEKLGELNAEYEELIWEGEEETGSIYANDWADYAYEAMVARYGDDFRNAFDTEGVGTGSRLVPHYYYDGTLSEEAKQFVGEEGANDNEINSTRLEYTTEGLDNKQEIALTVPTIEPWNQSDDIHFGDAGGGRAVAWIRFGETVSPRKMQEVKRVEEFAEPYRNVNGHDVYKPKDNPRSKDFIVSGMLKTGNVGFVVFINDKQVPVAYNSLDEAIAGMNQYYREHPVSRTVNDSVLVIDEIQSKRHQEGREKGYSFGLSKVKEAEDKWAEWNGKMREKYGPWPDRKSMTKEEQDEGDKLSKDIDEARSLYMQTKEGIPSAPFEKNWHELAMKRMLRYAAENGFDKVAWTTGAQQAERYSLSKVVESIECNRVGKNGNKSFVLKGVDYNVISNKEGVVVAGPEEFKGKQLSEVVGVSLADKMFGMEEGDVLNNTDLRIGGEGMKGFYDKMLPSFVQKYTKKWGAKVGEVELPHLEEGAQKMWSVDVTPDMKESVMEGQTMFRVTDDSPADAMRRAYDGEMRTARFLTKETMVDYLASVKSLLDTIAEKTGKGITDPQNVYRAMLTLTNKNTQELAAFDYGVLPHLTKAIAGILGKEWNGDWDAPEASTLQRYAKVKHGIERDRDMAVRRAIPRMAEQKYREQFGELDRMIAAETDAEALEALRTKKSAMLADPKAHGMQTVDEIAEQMEQQWYGRIAEIRRGEGTWREKQQRMDAAIAAVFDLDAEGLETYGLTLTEDYSGMTETLLAEGETDRKTARKVSGAVRAAAYDFVEQYEERTGSDKTDALWDGVRAVSDFSLEKQRRTGLVDAKYVEDCKRRYEFYVPLRNFAETTADEVYDYLDETYNDNNPVKTARGRRSEAGNPFSNVMMLGYQSITAGNKNAAVQHFWNLASRPDVKGFLVPSRTWHLAELDDAQREEVNEKLGGIADTTGDVILPRIPENATAQQVQDIISDFEDVMKDLKKRGLAFQGKKRARQEYRLTSKQQANAHRVKVYVNGEARYVTIVGDPRAALALNGKLNPESGVPEKYKAMQQFLSGAFTSQNPSFALANIIRDTQHANMRAFITESGRYWAKFSAKQAAMMKPGRLAFLLAKYENSMGNTGRHGWGGELDMRNETHRNFKRFMELGGATGYTFSHKEIENLKKLADMAERAEGKTPKGQGYVVGEIFDFIRLCSESAELINRFAAFEASLEMGRSEQRAISDAQEITLNFSRKGAGKKTYNPDRKGKTWLESRKYNAVNAIAWLSQFGRDHIIFWNAAVQGSYQTYEMFKEHPAKTTFALVGVPMALSSLALPALNAMICALIGDDDDAYYDELPDYVRQRNICIKNPFGKGWLKIPLDPATQKVWAMGDAIGAAWRGKRQIDYWGDLGANAVGLFSPVDIYWGDRNDNLSERALSAATSFTPTLIQPLLHSYANRDWKGKPLYNDSRYIDQLPSYAKSFKSDKESLKALSKFLNDVGNSDADSYGRTWHDFAPPGVMEELLYGYTGGYGQLALAAVEGAIAVVSDDAKGNFRWDNMPVVNRLWVEGDPGQTRLNIYRNYRDTAVDFMENVEQRRSQINREYKEAKRSHDTFAEAEALAKMKQLYDGDYQRYEILNNSDKLFQKYMKGSRIEDVPDFVIKGMLEAIEIVNNPDGETEEKKSENDK